MASLVFGDVRASLFVAGAVFGDVDLLWEVAGARNAELWGKSKLCDRTDSFLGFHAQFMIASFASFAVSLDLHSLIVFWV